VQIFLILKYSPLFVSRVPDIKFFLLLLALSTWISLQFVSRIYLRSGHLFVLPSSSQPEHRVLCALNQKKQGILSILRFLCSLPFYAFFFAYVMFWFHDSYPLSNGFIRYNMFMKRSKYFLKANIGPNRICGRIKRHIMFKAVSSVVSGE
jgi:hypothetical protein